MMLLPFGPLISTIENGGIFDGSRVENCELPIIFFSEYAPFGPPSMAGPESGEYVDETPVCHFGAGATDGSAASPGDTNGLLKTYFGRRSLSHCVSGETGAGAGVTGAGIGLVIGVDAGTVCTTVGFVGFEAAGTAGGA